MNMSKHIHSPSSSLYKTPCDNEAMCETKITNHLENETDECLSKNSISVNAESESTEQPVNLTQHEDIKSGSSKTNVTSCDYTAVASETDGGWGWVIAFGVFFIAALVGGVVFSFSLLYLEFVVMFDASRAVAGWIGSLHLFTSHILGNNNSYLLTVNFVLFFCIDMRILNVHCSFC